MAKRKYDYYQVANEYGVENYFEYAQAFSVYQKQHKPATLWGIDENGDFTCIMSK